MEGVNDILASYLFLSIESQQKRIDLLMWEGLKLIQNQFTYQLNQQKTVDLYILANSVHTLV